MSLSVALRLKHSALYGPSDEVPATRRRCSIPRPCSCSSALIAHVFRALHRKLGKYTFALISPFRSNCRPQFHILQAFSVMLFIQIYAVLLKTTLSRSIKVTQKCIFRYLYSKYSIVSRARIYLTVCISSLLFSLPHTSVFPVPHLHMSSKSSLSPVYIFSFYYRPELLPCKHTPCNLKGPV